MKAKCQQPPAAEMRRILPQSLHGAHGSCNNLISDLEIPYPIEESISVALGHSVCGPLLGNIYIHTHIYTKYMKLQRIIPLLHSIKSSALYLQLSMSHTPSSLIKEH